MNTSGSGPANKASQPATGADPAASGEADFDTALADAVDFDLRIAPKLAKGAAYSCLRAADIGVSSGSPHE